MSENSTNIDDLIPSKFDLGDDIFDDGMSEAADDISAEINAEIRQYKQENKPEKRETKIDELISNEEVSPERLSPSKKKKVHFEGAVPVAEPSAIQSSKHNITMEECSSKLQEELITVSEKMNEHYKEQIAELEKQLLVDREELSKKSKIFENYKTSLISVILFLMFNIPALQSVIVKIAPKAIQNSPVLKLVYLAIIFAIIQIVATVFA
jgi:hypothetical protein